MTRDPSAAAEARTIKEVLDRHRTLDLLRSSQDWKELEPRLKRLLGTVRRYEPERAPEPPVDPRRLRAVHWNIEHGNWYDQVERALTTHPDLRTADLYLFNEIDLGMARAGNRDVTGDLAKALGFHGVWAPLFLETTPGRDDDVAMAAGQGNEEALFGLAILSRWPFGAVRVLELPSPEAIQFDLERMVGRHIALIAEVERPGAPFLAVSAHLEVHRTRAHRAVEMKTIMNALEGVRRPVVLAGDFNTHTFDRGLWHTPFTGGASLLTWPGLALRKRLHYPDRGPFREPLFQVMRSHGFEWEKFVDRLSTLQLRLDRLDEVNVLPAWVRAPAAGVLAWAEQRGGLRLDWFAGRGWRNGLGFTIHGLDGRGKASDHAPIVAEFE